MKKTYKLLFYFLQDTNHIRLPENFGYCAEFIKSFKPLFLFLLLSFIISPKNILAQLPDDFQRVELASGLANTTTMSIAPDGRIFLLDRYGEILIYKTSNQSLVSAGNIPVFHELEDGLLGIAFDPNFLVNNYIYLHYSPESSSVNRVSRFTMNGDVLDISSEVIVLDWPSQRATCCHSGGDMAFDSQGNLYIATGDNSQHTDYSALYENNIYWSAEKSSSNTNDLRGKILRITPQPNGTYTIPNGNLFPSGTSNTRPEIYVMGARNPYRMYVDKEDTDWIFWGDVGPDANNSGPEGPIGLDEMNLTKTAGNYGWPYFSGKNEAYQINYASPTYYNNPNSPKNISTWNTGVENLPVANPSWLEFKRENGNTWSIFSGPRYFYNQALDDQQRMPAEFDGLLFYYDFNTSKIWAVEMDSNGVVQSNEQLAPSVFAQSKDGFIDMEFGPDGHMYLLQYGAGCCPGNVGTGKLIRVDYTGVVSNSSPIVSISTDVTSGAIPLTVNFSSEGTTDPDGDSPLIYEWDFQSDDIVDSSQENTSHTFTVEGTYQARLRVRDGNGGLGVKVVTIYAGNNPATFSFNSPPDGGLVGWGDDIEIDLEVLDAQDGSTTNGGINCNDVKIVPSLGHLNHFHDDLTLNGCPQSTTLFYDGHDIYGGMDIYYVLGSNYTDSGNLTSFDQILLHPKKKEAEFFDSQNGTEIIENNDSAGGGTGVIRVDNNGFIVFEGRNLENITGVRYRVSSTAAGGSIELRNGSATGALIVTTDIPSTGGSNMWTDVESSFTDPGGKNDLYFVFKSSSGQSDIFNLNYIEFLGDGVSMDNSPPLVNEVVSNTSTQISVEFSEYVSQTSAENISNYSITNGVTVSSAILQSDKRTVLLTVSSISGGTIYELNISNVENEAGLKIVADSYELGTINPIRINTGGPQLIINGEIYEEDQYFSGGNTYSRNIDIEGTDNDEIYVTERFGDMSYEIPVEGNGTFDVRLHFAELYHGVGSTPGGVGNRIFNVQIEGAQVLSNFDIAAEAGVATVLIKDVNDVKVSDGSVSISFESLEGDAKISAIEILDSSSFDAIPSIHIVSPAQNSEVNSTFNVAFAISDWEIGRDNTHVHYYVDDVMIGPYYSYDPITIEDLSLGSHTIKIELFNPDHTGTGVFDEITVNVIEELSCNETDFPESWTVHELEENEYVAVYTFANYDLDGDGLKDIVTGGWWYKNPGSASGDWQKNIIGEGFGNVAHVYDFDNDGDMDLLGTTLGPSPDVYESVQLVWAQNDGKGNFTVFNNIPAGDSTYHEPFVAGLAGGIFDVNGPYQMAINWNGGESTGSPVQMLTPPAKNNITTETWSLVDISDDSSGEDIQAGDIDGDGDLDLFQGVNWLRNNGNGDWETFNTGITYPTTVDRSQLADFDRDGDLDAVVGQLGSAGSLELSWFDTPSDPTDPWIRNVISTNVRGSLSVFAIDIDFDGDKDIVVGEWKGAKRLLAFENDLCNSGEFVQHVLDDGALGYEHHDGARVVDIDNDGDLDVVSNGWTVDFIPRIYENTTSLPNTYRPIASAGVNQIITLPDNSVTINGSGNDPNGEIQSYLWTKENGPDGITMNGETTATLVLENLVEGSYIFRLSVTDEEGYIAFDEVTITVNEATGTGNTKAPIVNAGEDTVINLPQNSITLNGSGSDPDGGEVSFTWIQVNGPSATLSGDNTSELSISEMAAGVYEFTLTVTDDEGETASDQVKVTVIPENGLLAVAEASPVEGDVPLEVTFTGSNSVGEVTSQIWDFKDGTTSTEIDPVHTFINTGTYEVELTVTDNGGNQNTSSVTIIVLEVGEGQKMGIVVEKNPVTNGTAVFRLINQPEDMIMTGINLHDQQGKMISSYSTEDIVTVGDSYQISVDTLPDGLYFIRILMSQGDVVTLKLLINN
ncbi:PKD domain-containing protein [Flavobacteriaceae bacterium MAR_2009_75]|nr:PKD domain-containing protein [Flavobacteriaceae bacterium MAR_2009_75]